MKKLIFLWSVLSGCLCLVTAGVIPAVSGNVRTTNYSGYLIEADAVRGSTPDTSTIQGSWTLDVTWDGLDTVGANVESTIWLEDDLGNVIPFTLPGGAGAVTEKVEVEQFSLNAGSPAGQKVYSITLTPVGRLKPLRSYSLKAKYRVQPAGGNYGGYVNVPQHNSAPNTALYFHFKNTVSGDPGVNAVTYVNIDSWERRWMVAGSATQDSLRVLVNVFTLRFDDFDVAPVNQAVLSQLTLSLKRVSTGATVWTAPMKQVSLSVPSHGGGTGAAAVPVSVQGLTAFNLQVPAGVLVQGEEYAPVIEVEHSGEAGGVGGDDGVAQFSAQRLLRFSGRVFFGSLETTFDQVTNDPVADLYPNALPLPTSTLAVPAGHGSISSAVGASYGGVPLAVSIEPDGDAVYGDGTLIPVTGAGSVTYNGTVMERSGVALSMTGPRAEVVQVRLPRGMGYSTVAGTRVMKSKITLNDVSLQNDLLPVSALVPGTVYLTLERLPLVFSATGLSFLTSTGKFSFTPTGVAYDSFAELSVLETSGAGGLLNWSPAVPLHAGNDQVFRAAKVSGSDPVEVSTGSDGAAFVHTLKLGFNAGAWWTHFPQHWVVSMSGSATQDSVYEITNDVVDQDSVLKGVNEVLAYYTPDPKPEEGKPDCPYPAPAVGQRFFALSNVEKELQFLADGSLAAAMSAVDNTQPGPPYPGLSSLSWGTFATTPDLFAHGVNFSFGQGVPGRVMLPSHFLPWREASVTGLQMKHRAAAVHLSGRGAGLGGTQVEHPHDSSYQTGAADYAGFNVRRESAGSSLLGYSRLGGGSSVQYALMNESKLYIRPAGVSGRINSADNLAATVNGFHFDFDGMKLAFLDNTVAASRLDGGVAVGDSANPGNPQPCLFNLKFKNLLLWSNGALNTGEVDPNQPDKYLNYWRTTITPLSMDFVQPAPCGGPGGDNYLALGVETVLPALSEQKKLTGVLGFRSNGALITRAEQTEAEYAHTQLDSRLRPPGNIKLKGPGSSSYSVTPVSGIYLNHWSALTANPAEGFACIAGAIDVPFFQNLQAHLHTSASSTPGQNATVKVMSPPEALGPFTVAAFDPGNFGVPAGVGLASYHSHPNYRLTAEKDWLGVIPFEYPLKWNDTQRFFEMLVSDGVTTDLLVLSTKSRVRSLTPSMADIKFKADIGPTNLPSVDAGSLMGEVLNGVTGGIMDAVGVETPAVGSALSALASFEQCLADRADGLVQTAFTDSISRVRSILPVNASAAQFKSALVADLGSSFNLAAVPNAPIQGWKKPVMDKLDAVDSTANGLISVLNNASTLLDVVNAIQDVIGGSEPGAVLPAAVVEKMDYARGGLAALRTSLSSVRSGVNAVGLGGGGALPLAPDWGAIVDATLADLPAEPLSVGDNAVLAQALVQRFASDAGSARLMEHMRIQLSDVRDQLRGSMDAVFSGMNEVLQEGLGSPPSPQSAVGMAEMNFGKIDGYARINGDSLHELKLDVDLNLALGMDIDFDGWLLFRDLQSDTPKGACRMSAGVASELTLGAATEIPFGSSDTPTKLEVEAKFAFDENAAPNGVSGRFGIAGTGVEMGPVTIEQAELGFGFGGGDAYLYGKGAGRSDYADIEAALFVGKACMIYDVLGRVDPMVSELLAEPQVSSLINGGAPTGVFGFYAFGYGSISVNALLGIPPSCMLNLKAGAGIGGFYFARDTGLNPKYQAVVGLRQDFGVSGEILCLADIQARLSLVGALPTSGNDLLDTLTSPTGTVLGKGQAKVDVTVGYSPFDFTLSKTLRMNFAYKPLSFDLDF
jgi:hypothetical protein